MKKLKVETLGYDLEIKGNSLKVGCQTLSKEDAIKVANWILEHESEFMPELREGQWVSIKFRSGAAKRELIKVGKWYCSFDNETGFIGYRSDKSFRDVMSQYTSRWELLESEPDFLTAQCGTKIPLGVLVRTCQGERIFTLEGKIIQVNSEHGMDMNSHTNDTQGISRTVRFYEYFRTI